jgi:tRNA A37 threonylcarbamoyladenosine dehydratase
MDLLRTARVLVFGVGGVGSFAVEALARAGVGTLITVDFDVVHPSNINRQIHADSTTVGRPKVDVMTERILRINPDATVIAKAERVVPGEAGTWLDAQPVDWVVDAIDEGKAKLDLLTECVRRGLKVVSSMGAAGKILTGPIRVGDISQTRQCPLARTIRKKLRQRGIDRGITVVYSEELPVRLASGGFQAETPENPGERRAQGTISYMPAMFGLHCAAAVIQDLLHPVPFTRRGDTPRSGNAETLKA